MEERLTDELRTKFSNIHKEHRDAGLLMSGDKARSLFMQSGLPMDVLGKVWALSDTDKDGCLDCREFSIAMHLIMVVKKTGCPLPLELPQHLAFGGAPQQQQQAPSFGGPGALPGGPALFPAPAADFSTPPMPGLSAGGAPGGQASFQPLPLPLPMTQPQQAPSWAPGGAMGAGGAGFPPLGGGGGGGGFPGSQAGAPAPMPGMLRKDPALEEMEQQLQRRRRTVQELLEAMQATQELLGKNLATAGEKHDMLLQLKAQEQVLQDKQLQQEQTKAHLQSFVQRIQDTIDDSDGRSSKLGANVDRLHKEIEALHEEERHNSAKVRDSLAKAEQAERELAKQSEDLKRVQAFISEGNHAISSMENECARLTSVKHQLEAEAGQQQHKLDNITQQLTVLDSRKVSLEASISDLEGQLAGSNSKVDTCKQEVEEKRAHAIELTTKESELRRELQGYNDQMGRITKYASHADLEKCSSALSDAKHSLALFATYSSQIIDGSPRSTLDPAASMALSGSGSVDLFPSNPESSTTTQPAAVENAEKEKAEAEKAADRGMSDLFAAPTRAASGSSFNTSTKSVPPPEEGESPLFISVKGNDLFGAPPAFASSASADPPAPIMAEDAPKPPTDAAPAASLFDTTPAFESAAPAAPPSEGLFGAAPAFPEAVGGGSGSGDAFPAVPAGDSAVPVFFPTTVESSAAEFGAFGAAVASSSGAEAGGLFGAAPAFPVVEAGGVSSASLFPEASVGAFGASSAAETQPASFDAFGGAFQPAVPDPAAAPPAVQAPPKQQQDLPPADAHAAAAKWDDDDWGSPNVEASGWDPEFGTPSPHPSKQGGAQEKPAGVVPPPGGQGWGFGEGTSGAAAAGGGDAEWFD